MLLLFDQSNALDSIDHAVNVMGYCIVSVHLYSASCSAYQSEALPVRENQREESSREECRDGD